MSQARSSSLACIGLAVLTVLAYGPLWRNDFIDFDDEMYVTKNANVRGGLSWSGLRWAWTTFHAGNWHPLTWLSLQVDATLFGSQGRPPSPAGVHAVNLGWHLATTLLLFAFLRRTSGRFGPSLVVAALFAVHPLHVESVAWACGRKDTLSTFFWVLALWAYARYAEMPRMDRYLLVMLAFVLGLLSKPMLVTLPCTLLLLDYWPLRRASRGQSLGWLLVEKLPLFCLAAGASVLTVLAQRHGNAVVPIEVLPVSVRLGHAVTSYNWYLEKTFWPSGLALFYPNFRTMPSMAALVPGTAVLLAITLAAVVGVRRRPWLIVGWLWFLGTLVPVIGLVQVGDQATADRYSYVPHIGLFIALIWTLADVFPGLRLSAVVQSGLAAVGLAVLAGLTWRQVASWHNTETVWRHALEVTESNHVAYVNLARDLFGRARQTNELALTKEARALHQEALALSQESRALYEESQALYARAVEVLPDVAAYRYSLGTVLLDRGRLDEAFDQFTATVKRQKDHADAWHNMGVVRLRQRHYQQAARLFEQALACSPQAPDTLAVLGNVLWQLGRRQEAEARWKEALTIHPKEPEALAGMGLVLLRQGKGREAEEVFKAALHERPSLANAYGPLGIALGRSGKWREAAAAHQVAVQVEMQRAKVSGPSSAGDQGLALRRLAFALYMLGQADQAGAVSREAARVDPKGPQTDAVTAWALATDPDPAERDARAAYELARCACDLSADPPAEALDALAAALAALGRFEAAAWTARQARAKATGHLLQQIDARLKLYEKKQAFTVKKG